MARYGNLSCSYGAECRPRQLRNPTQALCRVLLVTIGKQSINEPRALQSSGLRRYAHCNADDDPDDCMASGIFKNLLEYRRALSDRLGPPGLAERESEVGTFETCQHAQRSLSGAIADIETLRKLNKRASAHRSRPATSYPPTDSLPRSGLVQYRFCDDLSLVPRLTPYDRGRSDKVKKRKRQGTYRSEPLLIRRTIFFRCLPANNSFLKRSIPNGHQHRRYSKTR
jgi:hypothetical protein